ncbi:MAG: hypothetical protein NXI00_16225 [Cytophagales bacterium]|nr:hypothetical protein [Cytophagales bacterium]
MGKLKMLGWGLTKALPSTFLLIFKRLILLLIFIFLALFFPFYIQTEIYDFAQSEPFSGESFYNPYQNWQSEGSQKANFHAHSEAWLGITNGGNSKAEITKAYSDKGYGIACLSNYQSISGQRAEKDFLPVYEHGFNLKKTHQLGIGAEGVSFMEFPFLQNLSQKQLIINRIKDHSKFVALAHPALMHGYSENDLKNLVNYDFIEVLSPYAVSLALWDVALSHGRRVWGLSNDDLHKITPQSIGKYFNVLSGQATHLASAEKLMKDGCFYAMHDKSGTCKLSLYDLTLKGDTLNFEFKGEPEKVFVISDNGDVFALFSKGKGVFLIPKNATYVRLEVSDRKGNLLITNPVIRNNEKEAAFSHTIINDFETMLYKVAVLTSTLFILLISFSNLTKRINFQIKDMIFKLSLAYS